jgi:4-aminobutyrate aminotransferase/(S)-3-amino-2-methylpropionate transaminase
MSTSPSEIGFERNIRTKLPGPKSLALQARRESSVSSALSDGFPVYIERAHGAILRDVDGNDLLDFGSGIAVTSIGHANPDVIDAVSSQVAAFTHTCFLVSPYENYINVCEKLAAITPGSHSKRSILVNSGSEAVENAVKIARYATGRQAIVVFDNAYHGRTNMKFDM